MKKIAVIFGTLIAIAGACFAYRYHVAVDRLRSIAMSGQYRALGLRLTLAAPVGGVKGLLHLQPYLEIPQVGLDATEWGDSVPVSLGKGRLKTSLWNSTAFQLVLDDRAVPGGEVEFQRLTFELGLPDQILSISAKSLRFLNKSSAAGETLTLQEPRLQLRPGEGPIPSQLTLGSADMTWEKGPPGRLQFGAIELDYSLTPAGTDWKWRSSFRGQGFTLQGDKVQGQGQPWTLTSEGVSAKWDAAKIQAWRKIWDSIPFTPDGKLKALSVLFNQLRTRLDQLDFRWGGLEMKAATWQMRMEPLDFSVHYLKEEGGYGWKSSGHWKSLTSNSGSNRFEISGLAFEGTQHYRGLSYEQWLDFAMRYYREFSLLMTPGSKPIWNPELLYLPYLAQMPDEMQGELSCGNLIWSRPDYHTQHRNLTLSFKGKEDGFNYRVRSDFESQGPAGFLPNVQNGKVDFSFSFPFPYRELVASARDQAESRPSPGLKQALVGKDSGLDWKWRVDLGQESFALALDLVAKADIGAWLLAAPSGSPTPDLDKLAQDFTDWFLKAGKLHYHIKVDRFSKFQAMIEKIKPGSSLTLGLAGAYVIVDPKADTLSLDLDMETGTITLNGKRNASLETLLRQKTGANR